jgi:hypothetical protein
MGGLKLVNILFTKCPVAVDLDYYLFVLFSCQVIKRLRALTPKGL